MITFWGKIVKNQMNFALRLLRTRHELFHLQEAAWKVQVTRNEVRTGGTQSSGPGLQKTPPHSDRWQTMHF